LRCSLGRMFAFLPQLLHGAVDQTEQSMSSLSERMECSEDWKIILKFCVERGFGC
jgi:hypothetical protein